MTIGCHWSFVLIVCFNWRWNSCWWNCCRFSDWGNCGWQCNVTAFWFDLYAFIETVFSCLKEHFFATEQKCEQKTIPLNCDEYSVYVELIFLYMDASLTTNFCKIIWNGIFHLKFIFLSSLRCWIVVSSFSLSAYEIDARMQMIACVMKSFKCRDRMT